MAKSKSNSNSNSNSDSSTSTASGKRGQRVVLPTGEPRVDFIRRRYYDEGLNDKGERIVTRSMIRKELAEMGHEVPYQIVFAATKTKTKPIPKPRGRSKESEGEDAGANA